MRAKGVGSTWHHARRGLTLSVLAFLFLSSTASAAVQRDQLCNGGGPCATAGTQVSWAALGEPLGGRMAGGGFVIIGGGAPPSSGNSAPAITEFLPADKSRFYQGAQVILSVKGSDAEGEALHYRFLVDGLVLQDWSSATSATWNSSSASFGWHTLQVEVRDAAKTTSQEHRSFIFWRPPTP